MVDDVDRVVLEDQAAGLVDDDLALRIVPAAGVVEGQRTVDDQRRLAAERVVTAAEVEAEIRTFGDRHGVGGIAAVVDVELGQQRFALADGRNGDVLLDAEVAVARRVAGREDHLGRLVGNTGAHGVGGAESGEADDRRLTAADVDHGAVGQASPRRVDVELLLAAVGDGHVAVRAIQDGAGGKSADRDHVLKRSRLIEVDDLDGAAGEVGRVDGDAARVGQRRAGQAAGGVEVDRARVGDRRSVQLGVDRDVDRARIGEPGGGVGEFGAVGQRQYGARVLDVEPMADVDARVVGDDLAGLAGAVGGEPGVLGTDVGEVEGADRHEGVGQIHLAVLHVDVAGPVLRRRLGAVADHVDRAERPRLGVAGAVRFLPPLGGDGDVREGGRIGLIALDHTVDHDLRGGGIAGRVALRVHVVGVVDVLTGHDHLGDEGDVLADGEGRDVARGADEILDLVVAHHVGAAVGLHIHRDVFRGGEGHVDVREEVLLAGRRRRDVGEEDDFVRHGVAVSIVAVEGEDVVDVVEGVEAVVSGDVADDDFVAHCLARPRRVDVDLGHVDIGDDDVAVVGEDELGAVAGDVNVGERARLIEVDDLLHAGEAGRVDGDRTVGVGELPAGVGRRRVDGDRAFVGDVVAVEAAAVGDGDAGAGDALERTAGIVVGQRQHRTGAVDDDRAVVARILAVLDHASRRHIGAGKHLERAAVLERIEAADRTVLEGHRRIDVFVGQVTGAVIDAAVERGVDRHRIRGIVHLERAGIDDRVGEAELVVALGGALLRRRGAAEDHISVVHVQNAEPGAGDRKAARHLERLGDGGLVGRQRRSGGDVAGDVDLEVISQRQAGRGKRISGEDGDRGVEEVIVEGDRGSGGGGENVGPIEGGVALQRGAQTVNVRILDDRIGIDLDPVAGERGDVQRHGAARRDRAVVGDALGGGQAGLAVHPDLALAADGEALAGVRMLEGRIGDGEKAVALAAERHAVVVSDGHFRAVGEVQRSGLILAALGFAGVAAVGVHVDESHIGVGDVDLVAVEQIVALDLAVDDVQHTVVGVRGGGVVPGDVEPRIGESGRGVDRLDVGVLEGHVGDRVAVGAAASAADEEPAGLPVDPGGAGEDDVLAVADASIAVEIARQFDDGLNALLGGGRRAVDGAEGVDAVGQSLAFVADGVTGGAARPGAVHIETRSKSRHLRFPFLVLFMSTLYLKSKHTNTTKRMPSFSTACALLCLRLFDFPVLLPYIIYTPGSSGPFSPPHHQTRRQHRRPRPDPSEQRPPELRPAAFRKLAQARRHRDAEIGEGPDDLPNRFLRHGADRQHRVRRIPAAHDAAEAISGGHAPRERDGQSRRGGCGMRFFGYDEHHGALTVVDLLLLALRRRSRLVLLEHARLDQTVDQLLHRVERREETLRGHDDADVALRNGRLAVLFRLERHEIETHHVAREVDLTDAVGENFFFGIHFFISPVLVRDLIFHFDRRATFPVYTRSDTETSSAGTAVMTPSGRSNPL